MPAYPPSSLDPRIDFCSRPGAVADVRAGMQAAVEEVRKRGLLVSEIVIPRPSRELFDEYL